MIECDFPVLPTVPVEKMLDNVASALKRNLPVIRKADDPPFRAHSKIMSIAGGGPSLADTFDEMDGLVCAVNGSLDFLTQRDIRPWACGVLDPGEHMVDIVQPHSGVFYYVASIVDPSVFDKLLEAECRVILWHPSGTPGMEDVLRILRPGNWLMVGGGCTMGLRWINIGYMLGFRNFHLHGMDSSFRDGATHAYPDRADDKETVEVEGFSTRPNFLAQASDFFKILERFRQPDMDPIKIKMFGTGLLQTLWDRFLKTPEGGSYV